MVSVDYPIPFENVWVFAFFSIDPYFSGELDLECFQVKWTEANNKNWPAYFQLFHSSSVLKV